MPSFWEIIVLIVNAAMVVGQGVLHRQARKMAKQADKIEKLEGELKASARQQVKDAIDAETGQLRQTMNLLSFQLQQHTERLKSGESDFDKIEKDAFEQRVQIIQEMAELSKAVRDETPSKEEFNRVAAKVDQATENIAGMRSTLEEMKRRKP